MCSSFSIFWMDFPFIFHFSVGFYIQILVYVFVCSFLPLFFGFAFFGWHLYPFFVFLGGFYTHFLFLVHLIIFTFVFAFLASFYISFLFGSFLLCFTFFGFQF